jgi:hypothetical protein
MSLSVQSGEDTKEGYGGNVYQSFSTVVHCSESIGGVRRYTSPKTEIPILPIR